MIKGRKYDYTNINKEEIQAWMQEGKSNTEIAALLGLSRHSFKRLKKDLKLQAEQRSAPFDIAKLNALTTAGKYSLKEMAEIMGETLGAIQHHRFQTKADNTRKKFPYKPWDFSAEQKSVLAGTLLGDASLRKGKKGINASLSFAHCITQTELFDYKADIFQNTQSYRKLKPQTPDARTGKVYETWTFGTRCHPNFTAIHNHLYPNGKKIISMEMLEWFDSRSLAVLHMDDGTRTRCGNVISTDGFDRQSCELFATYLEQTFGLVTTITGANQIYIPAAYVPRFTEIVSPYILPTLRYKLHCPL
jgi:hypothetical protein